MLAKKNRLTEERDFKRVYSRSRRLNGSFLSLRKMPNHKEQNRFGIVVPNYVVKKAARRNLIKRIIRAFIQKEIGNTSLGLDVIFKLERDFKNKEELIKDLEKLSKYLND